MSKPADIGIRYSKDEDLEVYMPLEESRGMYLYIEILKTALQDEIVTDDEAGILKVLAKLCFSLNAGPAQNHHKGTWPRSRRRRGRRPQDMNDICSQWWLAPDHSWKLFPNYLIY